MPCRRTLSMMVRIDRGKVRPAMVYNQTTSHHRTMYTGVGVGRVLTGSHVQSSVFRLFSISSVFE